MNNKASQLEIAEPRAEPALFEQYELILNSGLFDPEFYLENNPDVADQGLDPVLHYIEYGAREGRAPNRHFDTNFYLEQCGAHDISVDNALLHYLLDGRVRGIKVLRGEPNPDESTGQDEWKIELILSAGIFELAFYNGSYGFEFETDYDALRHFFYAGVKEGKKPNLFFDPVWYLDKNPDVRASGEQPLFHYLVSGDAEGRQPSIIFDPLWYRSKYGIADDQNALVHFLGNRSSGSFSPLEEFDIEYYSLNNKDVRDAGVDRFEHFLLWGFKEGRNPSPKFNLRYYVKRYLGGNSTVNPLLHFLEHKHEPGVFSEPPEGEISIADAVKSFTRPVAEFEEFKPIQKSAPRKAKVLAYYLPQFHSFPENDLWWGKGFTEWTNIARGVPRFKGHYQPRIPRDLGFYNLDSISALQQQVELAKGGGIYGFIYYYYWFNGKRLMEKPLEQFLESPAVDMPFCLMWANENWTRRWDGDEHEVLIKQDYEPNDDGKLIADFVRHFRDARYIRVDGRPLLMIYRPGIIPDSRTHIARWREIFKEQFGENPILLMAQAFDDFDPAVHGLDGAIEFPPHKLTAGMSMLNHALDFLDIDFTGQVFSYDEVVSRSLEEPMPAFPLIKTSVASWDNDARRQGSGLVITGSTPAKYEYWLQELIKKARAAPFFGEQFICVNAWNEWCEAAYLEPDIRYGSAYLNATGRAVVGAASSIGDYRLLLVGHDAFPSGAQHLLLNIARRLKADFGVQLEFLLLAGGKMEKAYRDVAPVSIASEPGTLATYIDRARSRGLTNAIVNTTAAARIVPELHAAGIESVCLVHELPRIIREKGLEAGARSALKCSRNVIFPSTAVRDRITQELEILTDDRMLVLPQGMYKEVKYNEADVAAVRAELGIAPEDKLIIGVGYADLRKGFDLFLQLWRQLAHGARMRTHCCWIGGIDPGLREWLSDEIEQANSAGTFHMPGYRDDVDAFLFAADAFALTSREDPFPTVIHEALAAGLPVFAFDKSGGMPTFLAEHRMGTVVPYCDVIAMAKTIQSAIRRPSTSMEVRRRRNFVEKHLDFGEYVRCLLQLALPQLATVSVAVPNYNYARFMPERLATIFQQTYPVHDITVLDDCSTDNSLELVPRLAEEWGRKIRFLPNTINSGSVFAQWRKAAEEAPGEFLWIAEADDLSEPTFLGALVEIMRADPAIRLGFSDSAAIGIDGNRLWDSYKAYYSQEEPASLSTTEVFDGPDFVQRHLAVRNLILNVSAVVWRRDALLRALDACQDELRQFRMAGDWRLYIEILADVGARVAYVADPLNIHRRHAESVTHALDVDRHVAEIASCQELAARKLNLPDALRVRQASYLETVKLELATKWGGRPAQKSVKDFKKRKPASSNPN